MRSRRPRPVKTAWSRLERRGFDLVLLDVWLPKMDGLATLEEIQAREIGADRDDDFGAWEYRDGGARDEAGRL